MHKYGFLLAFTLPLLALPALALGGTALYWVPIAAWVILPTADLLAGRNTWNPDPVEYQRLKQDTGYRRLLLAYAPLHFAVILLGAWLVTQHSLSLWQLAAAVLTVGTVTGGIGITVAHELGHHYRRTDRYAARLLLASVCYMHFTLEHNRGHHVRVATPDDPATARYGENMYRFYVRSVGGSFMHAWRLENSRLAKRGLSTWSWRNSMLWCLLAPLAIGLALLWLWGVGALIFFFAQAIVAFSLLEIVNYLEHYGLQRQRLADGSYERVGPAHSWNSSERLSSYFLFNLTRHSNHHIQAQRHYQLLEHLPASPQLPTGYVGMILLALFPPLWRTIMHPRLERHRESVVSEGP